MVHSSASTSGLSTGAMTVKFGVQLRTKPSRFSKPILSPAISARRSVLKRIRKQELRRLGAMLPGLRQRRADELSIVREAVRYIDQLHSTIMARLYSGSLSLESVAERIHPFTLRELQRRYTPAFNQSHIAVLNHPLSDMNRNGNRENQVNQPSVEQRKRTYNKMSL